MEYSKELLDAITVEAGTRQVLVTAMVIDTTLGTSARAEYVAFALGYYVLPEDITDTYFKELFIRSMADRGLTIVTNEEGEN
jgi:hypothetical protein